VWLTLRPTPGTVVPQPTPLPTSPAIVSTETYAEINAVPWATVKAISPAKGDAQNAIGTTTPLRVKLPAGQYSVTLEGPNHERKQTVITVPQEGGTSCFIPFKKPDINQLLNR
jgi:hypothetical protein